ncbi:MAG: transporter substrate-binding domain-containing protein [Pseudomonadota bacterium]
MATLHSGAIAAADGPSFVQSKTLTVCQDPTFPPMEFMAKAGDTEPSGFDADLARALAEHWGVAAKFVTMDFAGLLPSLEAKRCDMVISGILVTEERTKKFDAAPYMATFGILFGKAGTQPVSDIAALSGQTIAVQTGTTYVDRVQALSDQVVAKGGEPLNIQLYPKATDVFQQVVIGRAFAGSSQDTEISYRDLQNPGELTTVYTFPEKSSFGIYLRKDPADLDAVLAAVKALRESGKLGQIAGGWKLSTSQIDAAAQ